MDKRELLNLIEKYERGECSSREKDLLDLYLESFQSENTEWLSKEMGDQKLLEEKIYSAIERKINNEKMNDLKKIIFSTQVLKRVATIIFFIVLVSGAFYYSGIFKQKENLITWNEKSTSLGEKSILTFLDGTKITLNAGSKLKFPVGTAQKVWEVYLEGEAYFEVHPDKYRQFVVHSENLSTTVLGTKFNVNAFPEEKTITVSLVEGSVKVSKNEKGNSESLLVLQPKQQLLYDKESQLSTFEEFDLQKAVGWKDNSFKFESEPLSKVLSQLEKAYGVKFELLNKSYANRKITAKFEDSPLWTISEVIKKLTGLEYRIIKENNETKKIVFYKK